jgi:hypothetical protein
MRRRSLVHIRSYCIFAFAILAAFAMSGSAVLARQPAGNDGTVKIHDGATETEPIVRNEPHVTTFHLHFLFADPTQTGDWEIRVWAPGDKGAVMLSGRYDTAPDGSDRQPAVGAYSLPSGHYKLFWEGRNDHNIKHKTFWVAAGAAPTATVQPTGSVAPTQTATPTGAVEAETGAATLPPTDALPVATGQSGGGLAAVLSILVIVSGLALLTTRQAGITRR